MDLDPEDPEEEIDLDPDPLTDATVEQLLPVERNPRSHGDYLTELAWDGPTGHNDTRVREVGTSTKQRENPQPATVTEEALWQELQDWEEHLRTGHQPKRKDCSTCQQADGPMEVHKSRKTEATSGRTLHLDLAGPYETSELNASKYILVAAYRGVDKGGAALPVLPYVTPLAGKHAIDVTAAVEDILSQIEALNCPWLQDGQRVVRVHSDRGPEFVNSTLRQALQARKIHQTLTRGYNPQANGTGESTGENNGP